MTGLNADVGKHDAMRDDEALEEEDGSREHLEYALSTAELHPCASFPDLRRPMPAQTFSQRLEGETSADVLPRGHMRRHTPLDD